MALRPSLSYKEVTSQIKLYNVTSFLRTYALVFIDIAYQNSLKLNAPSLYENGMKVYFSDEYEKACYYLEITSDGIYNYHGVDIYGIPFSGTNLAVLNSVDGGLTRILYQLY